MISKEAWVTGSAVVREAGILKTDVSYDEIIDMSFVESVRKLRDPGTTRQKANHVRTDLEQVLTERDRRCSRPRLRRARASASGRRAHHRRNYAFCDERPMPILESIKRWRNSCARTPGSPCPISSR
jgi:hypothetical protein